jgi:site-specific recombinase XerD
MPRRALYRERSDEYLRMLSYKLRSPGTIETYAKEFKCAWIFAKDHDWPSDPKKILPEHIASYFEYLKDLSSSTQCGYTGLLLNFLKWCGNAHCKDIELRIKVARTGRVDWMTTIEMAKFIGMAKEPWEKAILAILSYTGCRASEAADLTMNDVKSGYVDFRGKGRKGRRVPIDKEFLEEVHCYLEYRATLRTNSNRFLVHQYHNRVLEFNGQTVGDVVAKYSRPFGRHVSPHTIRRSWGRSLHLNGCPIETLSILMGHAKIEQTISYLGIRDSDLEAAINKYRPSFRTLREENRLKKDPA